jgi:hypothetical protein
VGQWAQQGAQGLGVVGRDHRQRRCARHRPYLRRAAPARVRRSRRQFRGSQRRIDLGMQADQQNRGRYPAEVVERDLARWRFENPAGQRRRRSAHLGQRGHLQQSRFARDDPLPQDRRQLLGVEQSPKAQVGVQANALRQAVDGQHQRLLRSVHAERTAFDGISIVELDRQTQGIGGGALGHLEAQAVTGARRRRAGSRRSSVAALPGDTATA